MNIKIQKHFSKSINFDGTRDSLARQERCSKGNGQLDTKYKNTHQDWEGSGVQHNTTSRWANWTWRLCQCESRRSSRSAPVRRGHCRPQTFEAFSCWHDCQRWTSSKRWQQIQNLYLYLWWKQSISCSRCMCLSKHNETCVHRIFMEFYWVNFSSRMHTYEGAVMSLTSSTSTVRVTAREL